MMAPINKSLYETLGISRNASLPEIQAAYRLLTLNIVSGKSGLSREESEIRLKEIDVAYHTLSDEGSRSAYDSQSTTSIIPAAVNAVAEVRALRIAAAIEDTHKISAMVEGAHESHLQIIASTISGTSSALKKILRIVIFLIVAGSVIQIVSRVASGRKMDIEASRAEEKLYIQDYYQKYGVRVGSKAEADLLDTERRRKENEQRTAELEKKRQADEYDRFVEESRKIGDQVSEDLRRSEEKARYEEEQKKREYARQMEQAERDRLNQEEAEQNRIEQERARTEGQGNQVGSTN
jgi:curved DNA-binding protein CbpA